MVGLNLQNLQVVQKQTLSLQASENILIFLIGRSLLLDSLKHLHQKNSYLTKKAGKGSSVGLESVHHQKMPSGRSLLLDILNICIRTFLIKTKRKKRSFRWTRININKTFSSAGQLGIRLVAWSSFSPGPEV